MSIAQPKNGTYELFVIDMDRMREQSRYFGQRSRTLLAAMAARRARGPAQPANPPMNPAVR